MKNKTHVKECTTILKSLPKKEEFDRHYNQCHFDNEKLHHEGSLPWDITNYEYCKQNSVHSILKTWEKHSKESENLDNHPANNTAIDIADIFDTICDFSDDEDEEAIDEQSEESSILSSEEEDALNNPPKIIHIRINSY